MNYRKRADKQDRKLSEDTGWKKQINSGALKGRKGDLTSSNEPITVLVETKFLTSETSFNVKKDWLDKIRDQAFSMGKNLAVLVFSFTSHDSYAVISLKEFNNLLTIANNNLRDLEANNEDQL